MGFFTEKKPYTAISADCNAIITSGGEGTQKLVDLLELINGGNSSGALEAGRAIRNHIKNGSAAEQIRALSLLETLVDNSVRTSYLVIESKLSGSLLQLAAQHVSHPKADLTKGAKAAKQCRSLLTAWAQSRDSNINTLFTKAGLVDRRALQRRHRSSFSPDDDLDEMMFKRSDEHKALPRKQRLHLSMLSDQPIQSTPESPTRASRSHRRLSSSARRFARTPSPSDGRRSSMPPDSPDSPVSPVNLRGQSLDTTVATAHNIATRLSNALITHEPRQAAEYSQQGQQLRKRIVKLIHDPSKEVQEYLGKLISANEELVNSLQAYDAIKDGETLAEQDDHVPLEPIKPSVQPLRPPPPPPTELKFDQLSLTEPVTPVDDVPKAISNDPFADNFEQEERPKHTPMW